MFKYATVCSGVEGCSLALNAAPPTRGAWEPVFFAEIADFPSAVLAHYYPEVPNLGDISKIHYNKDANEITYEMHLPKKEVATGRIPFCGRLDLLAGGTPCQDFSVAGSRAGAEKGSGTRSSLCWEWLRLVKEFQPKVLLWENVVGAFSSNGGKDFSRLVSEITKLGYGCAWRVLDCEFSRVDVWPMAIPQRRRRIWLVGCAGADVQGAGEILFEPESLCGNTPPRRQTWQEVARTPEGSTPGADGRHYITHDRTRTSDVDVARPLYGTDYKDGQTVCPVGAEE